MISSLAVVWLELSPWQTSPLESYLKGTHAWSTVRDSALSELQSEKEFSLKTYQYPY